MSAAPAGSSAKQASRSRGRMVRLSRPRRWITDVLYFSRFVPTVSLRITLDVAVAAARRAALKRRPGWSVLLMKACGRAASRHEALRSAFMTLPWPHLYEHPHSVATLVVEREVDGEPAVMGDQIPAPEHQSITALDRAVRHLNTGPVASIGGFRRIMRIASYPLPLRRLLMAGVLQGSGVARVRYFGTFAVNALRAPHAEMTHFLSPLAISLHYGVVDPEGRMPILVLFDHRVIDALPLIRMFDDVAAALRGEIADELAAMALDGVHADAAAH